MAFPAASKMVSLTDVGKDYQLFLEQKVRFDLVSQLKKEVNSVNTVALKRRSESILGTTCGDPIWFASGGFKLVFGMTTDANGDIVARICRRNFMDAGEIKQRILSEVATVDWVRRNTTIPVPEIYGYEADASCDVGSAFILEERILERPAEPFFEHPDLRANFIDQVIGYYSQLLNHPVSAIGVFQPGPVGEEPSIGPISPGVGPFLSSEAWCDALAEKMQAFLDSEKFITEWRVWYSHLSAEPDRQHIQAQFDRVVAAHHILVQRHSGDAEHFVVQHIDLGFPNVLVDYDHPSRIVAIIDWEGARTVPLWELRRLPPVLELMDSSQEQAGPSVWERLSGSQMPTKVFLEDLEDAIFRQQVRRILELKWYYTGPPNYNLTKELAEVQAGLSMLS